MKPPVLRPGGFPVPPPVDPRPGLWATGGIFAVTGVGILLFDHPLVPITHVFGIVPVALGGAVGCAVLRERYGPRAVAAYLVLMVWLLWQTVANQTTVGVILLATGLFSLTRALLKTVAD